MILHDHLNFIPRILGWISIPKSINIIYNMNERKDRNHMTISIDTEKAFDKTSYLFLIQPPKETRSKRKISPNNKGNKLGENIGPAEKNSKDFC